MPRRPVAARRVGAAGPALVLALIVCAGLQTGCSRGGITPIRTAFNRGVHHYTGGRYDQAVHEYRDQLSENPNDQRARFNLALTLECQAHESEDDEAEDLRSEAAALYGQILVHDPHHLRAGINMAAMEHEDGDVDAAVARLDAVIERYPRVVLPRTALAAIYLKEGRAADAERVLREALRIDSASVEANMLMGDTLVVLERFDGAADAYHRALATEPTDVATMLALARLDVRRGDDRAAVSVLQRLLYVDPEHWEAHMLMADSAERLGQVHRAAQHLWLARQLDHQRPSETQRQDYDGRISALYSRMSSEESADQ